MAEIDERLRTYDWAEAFAYAGDRGGEDGFGFGAPCIEPVMPGVDVSLAPFGRIDVVEVCALSEGENDIEDWLAFGRISDGRWFLLAAGCDYTGWD